jgi:hypothetical protein
MVLPSASAHVSSSPHEYAASAPHRASLVQPLSLNMAHAGFPTSSVKANSARLTVSILTGNQGQPRAFPSGRSHSDSCENPRRLA